MRPEAPNSPQRFSPPRGFAVFAGIGALLVIGSSSLAIAEGVLVPKPLENGVAILRRNGDALFGSIEQNGSMVVVRGKDFEVRIPAKDIELVVQDLDEAYRIKAEKVTDVFADPHLSLAQWLIRRGMLVHARTEIDVAKSIEPNHRKIADLERKLQAARAAERTTKTEAPRPMVMIGHDRIKAALREAPSAARSQFATSIHPILVSRCNSTGCHDASGSRGFVLVPPGPGRNPPEKLVERNLYYAWLQINPEAPDESPLLTVPRSPHGGAESPVFEDAADPQLQALTRWANLVARAPTPVVKVASLDSKSFNRKNRLRDAIANNVPVEEEREAPAGPDEAVQERDPHIRNSVRAAEVAREPLESSLDSPSARPNSESTKRSSQASKKTSAFRPRDAFDPEIFNRKYHGNDSSSDENRDR